MKWLTQKQIKEAAKKSPKAAHDCVIKHWTQLATCTFRELLVAVKNVKVATGTDYCAYCIRYHYEGGVCNSCPIYKKTQQEDCENTPYCNADNAFTDFGDFQTLVEFNIFHKAAKKELKFLKTLRA